MTQEEVKQAFVGMQTDQQQRMLALLALSVTVAVRSAYTGQVEEHLVVRKLRTFNEVLHTVAGQLLRLIDRDLNRYPDDVFINALFELAQQGNCERDLADAFAWSFSVTS